MRNRIGPALSKRRLLSITRTNVQGFVSGMTRGDGSLSPKTVHGVYRRLVSIPEAAVCDRKIAHSPDVEITLPKVNKNVADSVVVLDPHRRAPRRPTQRHLG